MRKLRPALYLRGVLELPVEAILVTHGEPVLENASEALERALTS